MYTILVTSITILLQSINPSNKQTNNQSIDNPPALYYCILPSTMNLFHFTHCCAISRRDTHNNTAWMKVKSALHLCHPETFLRNLVQHLHLRLRVISAQLYRIRECPYCVRPVITFPWCEEAVLLLGKLTMKVWVRFGRVMS